MTERRIEDIEREIAEHWKRIARQDRLDENERRESLGLRPLPLPPSLLE